MDEFKKIPNASAYEINAEANVRKVADKKPVVVSKDGRALLKKDDGAWEYFVATDIAKSLFNDEPSQERPMAKEEKEVDEGNKDNALEWAVGVTEALIGPIGRKLASVAEEDPDSKNEPGQATLKALKKLQKKLKVPSDEIQGPQTDSAPKDEVAGILAKKCSESIKIWKLHQLGCSTKEILAHLKQPASKGHSFTSIIWRFKNNKKRRDKADSI